MEYIMDFKYYITISILFLIILYVVYKTKTPEVQHLNDPHTLRLIKKIERNDDNIKSLIATTLKYIKSKDNKELLVDTVNKKSLFNKDYRKIRLVIDTKNLIKGDNFKEGFYDYDFQDDALFVDRINSIGRIKNIIGFRLIKAIIPNKIYTISDRNDIICVKYDSGNLTIINLTHAIYSLELLFQCFPYIDYNTIDFGGRKMYINDVCEKTGKINFYCNIKFDIIYDEKTLKNTQLFTGGYLSDFEIKKLRNSAKTFGFKMKDYESKSFTNKFDPLIKDDCGIKDDFNDPGITKQIITSDIVPNLMIDYIDVVINEIPNIACITNTAGKKIIDRIPLSNKFGNNILYQPDLNYDINYFPPISLDKLSISLFEPGYFKYYNPEEADHTLEFELTVIINDNNVGLIGPGV